MGRFIDLVGKQFERLTVLSRSEDSPWGEVQWRVLCACGVEKVVPGSALRKGRTRSCGCLWAESRKVNRLLEPGVRARNQIWANYIRSAQNRGLSWELTSEQFDVLTASPCHYCGVEPLKTYVVKSGKFTYNGIDRVKNSIGYTETNVVPCCHVCNRAKSDMSYEDFVMWVQRSAAHLARKDC